MAESKGTALWSVISFNHAFTTNAFIANSNTVWYQKYLACCKRALRMGYSEICFRIARGCARPPPSYSEANL